MATFSADTASTTTSSYVRSVFARPVALRNEAKADAAPFKAGEIGLTVNYRAHKSNKGRPSRGRGTAVFDLSAFSTVEVDELPELIEGLKDLLASAPQGIAAAEDLVRDDA